jgi:hypothetical protein
VPGQPATREQRSKNTRRNTFGSDDDDQDGRRNQRGRQMRLLRVLKREEELSDEPVSTHLDAEHFVKLARGNLHPAAREKADEDCRRKKVCQEFQAEDSDDKQDYRRGRSEGGERDAYRDVRREPMRVDGNSPCMKQQTAHIMLCKTRAARTPWQQRFPAVGD